MSFQEIVCPANVSSQYVDSRYFGTQSCLQSFCNRYGSDTQLENSRWKGKKEKSNQQFKTLLVCYLPLILDYMHREPDLPLKEHAAWSALISPIRHWTGETLFKWIKWHQGLWMNDPYEPGFPNTHTKVTRNSGLGSFGNVIVSDSIRVASSTLLQQLLSSESHHESKGLFGPG